jgi:hypothetical protein
MVQPIDYRINVQSPFEAALSGFKVGAGMAEMQQQRELAKQKLQQQQIEAQEAARNKGYLTLAAQSLAAIDSGNPDAAVNLMQGRVDAARRSGDEEQANALDTWLQLVKFNPQSASSVINRLVTNTPGGKEMLDAAKLAGEEARKAALHPSELTQEKQKAIQEKINTLFFVQQKQAELKKTEVEALAPSVREAIDYQNLTPEQKALFGNLQILKKPPAPVTNVNVSNVIDKAAGAELGKLVPELYNQANASASFLIDVPRYKRSLDSAITGPLANERLAASRISSALGFGGEKGIVATTEVIKALAKMTLDGRKTMRGEGQITDSESKLAERAFSGDISLTKGELMSLFNASERAAKFQYTQSKKLLTSAASKAPTAELFLQNVVEPPKSESVNVGGQTYERPSSFTDAQWNAYKQSMGVK